MTASGGTSTSNCADVAPPNQTTTCAEWASWNQCGSTWFLTGNFCAATCGACGSTGATGGTTGVGTGGTTTTATGGTTSATGGTTATATGGTTTTATGGTTSATGGTGSGTTLPPLTGGSDGWASRYWDCCKPHCGWSGNVTSGNPLSSCSQSNQSLGSNYDAKNGCESGGTAFMCYSYAPWSVSDSLSYGFAAYNGGSCGTCYQVQFTGSSHNGGADSGASGLNGKQMVVQIINIGGIEANQFDLLIPGGGVGAMNGCSTQWGTSDLGSTYGGFLAACGSASDKKACVLQKCQSVFGASDRADLLAGCQWFLNWFGAADNPNLKYKQITCPDAIVAKSGLRG